MDFKAVFMTGRFIFQMSNTHGEKDKNNLKFIS